MRDHRWRRRLRALAIGAAAIAVVGTSVVVLLELKAARDRISMSEFDAQISAALPQGSSEAEVNAYLERRKIPHGSLQIENPSTVPDLAGLNLPPNAWVVVGSIGQSRSLIWFLDEELRVYFILDAERRLVRHVVEKYVSNAP